RGEGTLTGAPMLRNIVAGLLPVHGSPVAIATHCPRPKGGGTTAGSVADGRSLSTAGAECDAPENDVLKGRSSRNPQGFEERSMSTAGASEEAGGRAGCDGRTSGA